ncbi:MAG: site-2 protease family protein [Eubacterium sp.]
MFSLISLIRSGQTLEAVIFILSGCFVVFVCSPVHELAHGYAAYKLGDNTAKNQGRLTFNPIAHIDPIGMIMILVFGFGYAKPVPVNPRNFKNQKGGMALTALAGPVSNLIMAFVSIFIYYLLSAVLTSYNLFTALLLNFFYFSAYINVSLGVFNLIPIPPLDGSKILASVLPDRIYYKYMMYERYVMIALMVILFTGVLNRFISFLSSYMMEFISFIPRLIFT